MSQQIFPLLPPPVEHNLVSNKKGRIFFAFGIIFVLFSTFFLIWGAQKREILATISLNDANLSSSQELKSLQEARNYILQKNSSKISVLVKTSEPKNVLSLTFPIKDMGFTYEIHPSLIEENDLQKITPFFHGSADKNLDIAQLTVDPNIWSSFIQDLDDKVSTPYQAEKLSWTNENGWVFQPEHKGEKLDKKQALSIFHRLKKNLLSHKTPKNLRFSTITISGPSIIRKSSTSDKNAVLQGFIQTPIILKIADIEHTLDLNSSSDYLLFDNNKISLNLDKIRSFVQKIADEYYIPSATVRITGKKELRPKVFKAVTEGNFDHGSRVNADEIMAMIEGYLSHQISLTLDPSGPKPDEKRVLDIPIYDVPVKIYSELADAPLELISVGFSEYSTGNNPNRVHNIKTGLSRLNGTIISPEETISFNRMTGKIDGEFRMGYSIVGSRAIPSLGGGICQVSTTFYRALLNLGIPVTQRQNHSWDLSYYAKGGYGLDATIYPSVGLDLKAVNDLDSDLFFYTYTIPEKEEAYVLVYGISDGRKITLKPEEDYVFKPGAKTLKWTQTIEKTDGDVILNDIISRYRS